jgi:hypothetical protein
MEFWWCGCSPFPFFSFSTSPLLLSLSLSLCFFGSFFFLHWSVKYEREIEKNRREGGREGGRHLLFLPFLCLCFCFNLPPHLFLCFFFFYLVFLILILLFQMIFTIDGCLMRINWPMKARHFKLLGMVAIMYLVKKIVKDFCI